MMCKKEICPLIKKTGAILFWIALWYIAAIIVDSTLLMPTPLQTADRLLELAGTAKFYQALGMSLLRILSGFLLGMISGAVLGLLSAKVHTVKYLLDPPVSLIRTAPVASFIVLALVWMKTGVLPVFISSLMVLPIFYSSIQEGIFSIDKNLREYCDVIKAAKSERYRAYIRPALLPPLRIAAVNGAGLAWKSGIAAEVICRPYFALGTLLSNGKSTLDTSQVFAVTLTIIIISMLFSAILKKIWGQAS